MTSVISLGRVPSFGDGDGGLSGAGGGGGGGRLGLPEGLVSREEFDRVFKDWVRRQAKVEEALGKQFGVLQKWLSLGVATCDQLQRYNNRALAVNLFNQRVRRLMVESGLEGVPPVPRPLLFGSSAASEFDEGIETFQVDLQCDGQGFPEKSVRANVCATRSVIDPQNPEQPSGGVNGLGALTLATAGAWAIVFIAAGGFALLGAKAWEVFQRGMPSNIFNQMKERLFAKKLQQDLKRLEAADKCYETSLRNLDPQKRGDLQVLRQLKADCDKRAKELIPDRDIPDLERPAGPTRVAKALLLGGVAVAGTVVIWRFAKPEGGGGVPPAKAREGFRERRRRKQREQEEARKEVGEEAARACAGKKGGRFRRCIEEQIRAAEARS